MFHLENLKSQTDLLSIIARQTHLKKIATTQGGEWAGPCPFCPEGGSDRFHVQPYARPFPRWMCRHCTAGQWDSLIGFIARRDGPKPGKKMALPEICHRAGVSPTVAAGPIPTAVYPSSSGVYPSISGMFPSNAGVDPSSSPNVPRLRRSITPAYAPPGEDWQAAARDIIAVCEAALWQPEGALAREYLYQRGLSGETIRHFHLGFCSTARPGQWGREIAGLYVPRGLVIPCLTGGKIWYLKIRLVPGIPCRCRHCKSGLPGPGVCPRCGQDTRCLGVQGGQPAALFNGDALTSGQNMALFCEGELDCMTAWQEFGDILPAATFDASANRHPDLAAWGFYLRSFRSILVSCAAGRPVFTGTNWLMSISDRVRLAPLPAGYTDINEFHQKGGDLLGWIVDLQRFYLDAFFR